MRRDPGDLNLAIEWSLSAWNNLGIQIPVDLEKVRKHLGLYLRRVDLGHNDGHLLRTPKRWYVVTNIRQSIEKQRFTSAHEIGEYLLIQHYERQGKNPPVNGHTERFCDAFAANLLMPAEVVKQQLAELGHNRHNDKRDVLASRFGVSRQALTIRLRELGMGAHNIGMQREGQECLANYRSGL